MLFNSLHFYIFLPIVLLLYFNSKEKKQKLILLLSSIYFYSALKLAFLPLLYVSLLATHFASIKIHNSNEDKIRKFWLLFCLLINLGILVFFKYTDFLRSIYYDLNHLLGWSNTNQFDPINLVLPLGISFYTFQAIAYCIDVYRRQIPAEKSFYNFSLFLLFFPQLVAGPIIRASILIPQFDGLKKFNKENFIIGAEIIAFGLFKKTIVADPLATLIAPVYSNPGDYSWFANVMSMALFSIQIYCDFSGYSDIAIGAGKIMGFDIPINFKRPFLAKSMTEIWSRWHISLSSWLRDYLYISLGGNRVSKFRNYFNLFATMALGGIWHGAAWTFVIWGLIHATFLVVEKYCMEKGWNKFFEKVPTFFKILYSFSIFSFAVLFFRGESFTKSMTALKQTLSFSSGKNLEIGLSIILPVSFLIFIEVLEEKKKSLSDWLPLQSTIKEALMLAVVIITMMIYTVIASPQFYYFQF